jgi:hypothetical protein
MIRKVFMQILGAAAVGYLLTACEQSENKASSPRTSPTADPAAKGGQVAEKKQPPGLPASSGETEKKQPSDLPASLGTTEPPEGQAAVRLGGRTPMTPEQRKRFAQNLKVANPIQPLQVGQVVTIPVEVKNLGPEPWLMKRSPSGERPVKLWYHWINWKPEIQAPTEQSPSASEGKKKKPQGLHAPRNTGRLRKEGKVIEFGGIRTPLPHLVQPNEMVNVVATVKAPSQPGEFILRLTMMREGEGSFENKGGIPLDLPVTVTQ